MNRALKLAVGSLAALSLVAGAIPTFAAERSTAQRIAALKAQADAMDARVERLKDIDQIDLLVSMYGYYLEHFIWDAMADLFAEDGSIEIAARGVYVGKKRVRDSLDLYGIQGLHAQELHPHMPFQAVIDVAPDGKTAKLRRRAWLIMGVGTRNGTWGEVLYEDEVVKENGVWKFKTVHAMNTFFAPYTGGWPSLTATARNPGVSTAIPPDKPPSMAYDIFPGVNTPTFHYPNPVSGRVYEPTMKAAKQ